MSETNGKDSSERAPRLIDDLRALGRAHGFHDVRVIPAGVEDGDTCASGHFVHDPKDVVARCWQCNDILCARCPVLVCQHNSCDGARVYCPICIKKSRGKSYCRVHYEYDPEPMLVFGLMVVLFIISGIFKYWTSGCSSVWDALR